LKIFESFLVASVLIKPHQKGLSYSITAVQQEQLSNTVIKIMFSSTSAAIQSEMAEFIDYERFIAKSYYRLLAKCFTFWCWQRLEL